MELECFIVANAVLIINARRVWYINHVLSDFDFLDGMYVPQSDIKLAVNERPF